MSMTVIHVHVCIPSVPLLEWDVHQLETFLYFRMLGSKSMLGHGFPVVYTL